MEDLLLLMINEAIGVKHNAIRQTAQIAYDKLNRQNASYRNPSHELRSACFTALQLALDSRRPKFIALGLSGLQKIIKDQRFYAGIEPEDDSLWLPSQILRATSGLLTSNNNEENIVSIMRVLLTMACSTTCTLNGRILIEILNYCGVCWRGAANMNSVAIKAASLASASQCLRTFCSFLQDEAEELKRTITPVGLITQSQSTAVYNEVIPVMQWLCTRLLEQQSNFGHLNSPSSSTQRRHGENNYAIYLTECILTITSALPPNVYTNPHFTSFLWQKFCPTLAAALGSPIRLVTDKKLYTNYKDILENETRGFCTHSLGRDSAQTRCIYLTTVQLLRCAGRSSSLRPMLEALFHRMLLLPSPANRTEPLKIVRDIFRSLERIIDLTVVLPMDKMNVNANTNTTSLHGFNNCSDEMALFRLIIDAMEECTYDALASDCSNGNTIGGVGNGSGSSTSGNVLPDATRVHHPENSLEMSVKCMLVLLESLQNLSTLSSTEKGGGAKGDAGVIISDEIMNAVNRCYPQLKDADYLGPLTYQSITTTRSSSQAYHRHASTNDELREMIYENSSSSESDNHNQQSQHNHIYNDHLSNMSIDTEEPEEEEEQHSISSEEEITTPTTSSPTSSSVQYEETATHYTNWPYTPLESVHNSKSSSNNRNNSNDSNIRHDPSMIGHISNVIQTSSETDLVRENARRFCRILHTQLIPQLLQLRSSIEIDESIQEFASKFCDDCYCTSTNLNNSFLNTNDLNDDVDDLKAKSTSTIVMMMMVQQQQQQQQQIEPHKQPAHVSTNIQMINADVIYTAIYSGLLLNFQLKKDNYYSDTFKEKIPLSEQQFVTSVQNSGAATIPISSMSKDWLCELYQYILINDLLSPITLYDVVNVLSGERHSISLINVLSDAAVCGPTTTTVHQQQQQHSPQPTNSIVRKSSPPEANQATDQRRIINHQLREEAARKICRRLLTCCWDSMVTILTSGLDENLLNITKSNSGSGGSKIMKHLSQRKNKNSRNNRIRNQNAHNNRRRSLYYLCLEGLHMAVTLSNTLNLQHYAGNILELLSINICEITGSRFTTTQAIAMDVVISGGLLLGAYKSDCWESILKVCRHIDHMEHEIFHTIQYPSSMEHNRKNQTIGGISQNRNASSPMMMMGDDETCVDVYNFLQNSSCNSNAKISSILQDYKTTASYNYTAYLNPVDCNRVLCTLSQQMETLFNEAADQLTLPSLCQFLRYLCKASRDQLHKINFLTRKNNRCMTTTNLNLSAAAASSHTLSSATLASLSATTTPLAWCNSKNLRWRYRHLDSSLSLLLPSSMSSTTLLFQRVGNVVLRVFRSSRPLYHLLKIWSIAGPHLMDAACHRDPYVAKKAIDCIHEIIVALLVEQSELPHFHFNEGILKPLQNVIVQMKNTKREDNNPDNILNTTTTITGKDIEDVEREAAIERIQDQIISYLYEIVDVHCNEIRSGWRSLFAILSNAKPHLLLNNGNILVIFRIFLESDNVLIFANAGLDCIRCLLSFLDIIPRQQHHQTPIEQVTQYLNDVNHCKGMSNNSIIMDEIQVNNYRSSDLLHEVLSLLERCSNVLSFMYNLLNCPGFHVTNQNHNDNSRTDYPKFTNIIDTNIPNSMENFTYFGNDYLQTKNEEHMISYRSLHIDIESIINIEEIDKKSGVLKVWFLLLHGLMNSLIVAPQSHQGFIMQTLFKHLRGLLENPGIEFAFYAVNHLLLPTLQDWLRYMNDKNPLLNNSHKNGNNSNNNNSSNRTYSAPQTEKNFKQFCCMTTDILVEYIKLSFQQTYENDQQNEDQSHHFECPKSFEGSHAHQRHQQQHRLANHYERIKLKLIAEEREYDGKNNSDIDEDINANLDEVEMNVHLNSIPSSSSSLSSSSDEDYVLRNTNKSVEQLPPNSRISAAMTLALQQLLIVLVECSAQSQETIARVGISCLKHVILSTGSLFNECQWLIACSAIHRACTVTIAPLRQLSFAFNEKSNSFYGDCAIVKVAARLADNYTPEEFIRLQNLAQQVFLADNQRDENTINTMNFQQQQQSSTYHHQQYPTHNQKYQARYQQLQQLQQQRFSDDRRIYSFLLYPQNNGFNTNSENFVIRLPFKSIVIGLLANQMLLQLVAKLLLSRLKCVPQSVSMCIFSSYDAPATNTSDSGTDNHEEQRNKAETMNNDDTMPKTTQQHTNSMDKTNRDEKDSSSPTLPPTHEKYQLDFRSKEILLRCCVQFLTSALEFDSRPGLKFLMQKVANIPYSANLYRQMTSSWMIYYIALVDSYLNDINVYNLSTNDLLYILESCSRLNTTTLKQKENFVRYLFCLQDAWNLVCELYLTHHSDCIEMKNILATPSPKSTTTLSNTITATTPLTRTIPLSQGKYLKNSSTVPFAGLEEESSDINEEDPQANHHQFDIKINEQRASINHSDMESISPEIEQQRNESILKDLQYKRTSLAQLVIASMELLHSLPSEAENYLRLLITPTIREAFRLVQIQDQEMCTISATTPTS